MILSVISKKEDKMQMHMRLLDGYHTLFGAYATLKIKKTFMNARTM